MVILFYNTDNGFANKTMNEKNQNPQIFANDVNSNMVMMITDFNQFKTNGLKIQMIWNF